MYPFLTLDDDKKITHSALFTNNRVKVYVEKPDEKDCFNHMTCYLSDYTVEDVVGFSKMEQERYMEIIRSMAC